MKSRLHAEKRFNCLCSHKGSAQDSPDLHVLQIGYTVHRRTARFLAEVPTVNKHTEHVVQLPLSQGFRTLDSDQADMLMPGRVIISCVQAYKLSSIP